MKRRRLLIGAAGLAVLVAAGFALGPWWVERKAPRHGEGSFCPGERW